jgi:hypothetical protein
MAHGGKRKGAGRERGDAAKIGKAEATANTGRLAVARFRLVVVFDPCTRT